MTFGRFPSKGKTMQTLDELKTESPDFVALRAAINLCYTCSSCVTECPVNRATDRLRPLKLIRMASLGLFDELIRLPEIWYCLLCNRCKNVCPMTVKPPALIDYLRRTAVRTGVAGADVPQQIKAFVLALHRIRRQAVSHCLEGLDATQEPSDWLAPAETGTTAPACDVPPFQLVSNPLAFTKACTDYLGFPTNLTSCFTCTECSNSCPVSHERAVFDPMWVFRMIAFGYREEILKSPSIWLCLGCRSCTNACGQLVRGHLVFNRLQELALAGGIVDSRFPNRWRKTQDAIYCRFTEQIDSVLHLESEPSGSGRGVSGESPTLENVKDTVTL